MDNAVSPLQNLSTNPWNADIAVSPQQAAERIARQFPELAPVALEPFGEGWDNIAYRANGVFVFRFPRRQIAIPLLEAEAASATAPCARSAAPDTQHALPGKE